MKINLVFLKVQPLFKSYAHIIWQGRKYMNCNCLWWVLNYGICYNQQSCPDIQSPPPVRCWCDTWPLPKGETNINTSFLFVVARILSEKKTVHTPCQIVFSNIFLVLSPFDHFFSSANKVILDLHVNSSILFFCQFF